jgi:hypothetical protein
MGTKSLIHTVRIKAMKQERTYVAWLAGSVIGGLALVGTAAAADVQKGVVERAKPGVAVASADPAPTCDVKVADGKTVRGNAYDGLCLVSPPLGYVPPTDEPSSDTAALRRRPVARLMSMNLDPRPCTGDPTAASLEQA